MVLSCRNGDHSTNRQDMESDDPSYSSLGPSTADKSAHDTVLHTYDVIVHNRQPMNMIPHANSIPTRDEDPNNLFSNPAYKAVRCDQGHESSYEEVPHTHHE